MRGAFRLGVALGVIAAAWVPTASAAERGAATCHGFPATIIGTNGDDVLVGTTGDDVIVGLDGRDEIRGRGGADLICGGNGADSLYGGGGADILKGGRGADLIDGGAGDDLLAGWLGNDELWGRDGTDELKGGSGNDHAHGGPGFDACDAEHTTDCDRIPLEPGARGAAVRHLQRSLTEALLYRGPINGRYDDKTAAAVIAFHKVAERPRTDTWGAADWDRLASFRPRIPRQRADDPDRIEVDIEHQVIYLIEEDRVTAIMPTSTGGGYLYYSKRAEAWVSARTPRGSFRFFRHANGWNCDPLYGWCIYEPWSFTTGYALHGYTSVPTYPASHGCVRVHNWEADWLEDHIYIGMSIHIWDG